MDEFSEILPSGFAILSLENEQKIRTLYVNPTGNKIFGGTPEDYRENYQGRLLEEWPFSIRGNTVSQQDMIDLMQGKAVELTVPSLTINGKEIWLRASCRIKNKDNLQLIYAAFVDVTDIVLKEEEEKRRSDRYRIFSQLVRACIFDYDVERDLVNYSYYRRSGQLVEEDIPGGIEAFVNADPGIDQENRDILNAHLKRALANPCEGACEFLRKSREKEPQWYLFRYQSLSDERRGVYRIVGSVENIQTHKNTETCAGEKAFRLSVNENAVLSLCFDTVTGDRIPLAGDVRPVALPETVTLEQLSHIFRMIVHPDDDAAVKAFLQTNQIVSRKKGPTGKLQTECRIRSLGEADQGYRWARVNYLFTQNRAKDRQRLFIWIEDIDREKRELLEKLEQALRDPLTGLYNRHGFRKKSEQMFGQRSNRDEKFCLGLIVLDSFRRINEQYDISFGDELLVKTGQTISSLVRKDEICGRHDSVNFYILLRGHDRSEFEERLKVFSSSLIREIEPGEMLTASIGAACAVSDDADFDKLFHEAQQALHEARELGVNHCVFYQKDVETESEQTKIETSHKIEVRTFGYFDVFVDGQAVTFKHKKAKELLALLIDRRGGTLTIDEAISCLWENETSNKQTQARYRKAAMQLHKTLEHYGISYILEYSRGVRRIKTEYLECDLYDSLAGREDNFVPFHGNYLLNYSWGETTYSWLLNTKDSL